MNRPEQIPRQIRLSIVRRRLFDSCRHVLAAVSGGPDSAFLLWSLHILAPSLGIRLSAAHLNHGLRGEEADRDADFVRRLAGQWRVPLVLGRADVNRRARRNGVSVEMASREARYAFLEQAARRAGADAVATAHTADDQAETVLLKLSRGAGMRGLAGIPERLQRGDLVIVRPLLNVRRAAIERALRRAGLDWREDASNRNPAFLRNRVRHEILPLLRARLNPRMEEVLCRTADIVRAEDAWMDERARSMATSCRAADGRGLNVRRLREAPLGLRRRVVRTWLVNRGVPEAVVDFRLLERVETLLSSLRGTARIPLAGGRSVLRTYATLQVEHGEPAPQTVFRASVRRPGETCIPAAGLRVTVRREAGIRKARVLHPGTLPASVSVSPSAVGRRRLVVRSWRAGDRMRPLGLRGSQKIQDILVNAKVCAPQRSRIPVLECGGDIVWVAGFRVAEGWQVRSGEQTAWHIRVERI